MRLLPLWAGLFSLGLGGCYKWEASDNPISGLKLVTPGTDEFVGDTNAHFQGSVIANNLDSVHYGIAYRPLGYEAFIDSNNQFVPLNASQVLTDVGQGSGILEGDVFIPGNTLPGRYTFYSYATDKERHRSDSNLVNRRIISGFFPGITSSSPAFTTAATTQRRGDVVQLRFSSASNIDLQRITVRVCRVELNQLVDCNVQRVIEASGTTHTDTVNVQLPFDALPTQQYRAQILISNDSNYHYAWQPLFQIIE